MATPLEGVGFDGRDRDFEPRVGSIEIVVHFREASDPWARGNRGTICHQSKHQNGNKKRNLHYGKGMEKEERNNQPCSPINKNLPVGTRRCPKSGGFEKVEKKRPHMMSRGCLCQKVFVFWGARNSVIRLSVPDTFYHLIRVENIF